MAPELVLPSREDPVVRAASEVVGGPAGRRVRPGGSWWTPVRVLLVFVVLACGLGLLGKQHCRAEAFSRPDPDQYVHACYSDIPLLFASSGLDRGVTPYLADVPREQTLDAAVLTGAAMKLAAALVPEDGDPRTRTRTFFDVNVVLLAVAAAVTVVATARTAGPRPWDAALVALAPGLVLAGTISWDLYAVALSALALLAWARRRPVLAGLLLGLAVATKPYPLLLLLPLALLGVRTGRLRPVAAAALAATGSWLVTNLPVALLAPDAWSLYYRASLERGAGFGSAWYVAQQLLGVTVPDAGLDLAVAAAFLLCCAGIAALALRAPRRPRLGQLAFLTVAAFLLVHKVYSPQYVLWLLPLAALARPRWRDFLVWQLGEVVYFFGVWLFLVGLVAPDQANRALTVQGYAVAVLAHVLGTLWLVAVVVRDVLVPPADPVRAAGADDPAGGVFDDAPDAPRFASRPQPSAVPA